MKKKYGLGLGMAFSAIFFQACSSADSADELNQSLVGLQHSKMKAKSIAIPLSSVDVEYVNFLETLSDEIVRDSSVAKTFVDNPTGYCRDHGYNIHVNMDSGLLKLVLALGDEDLVEAAQKGDVKRYVSLCRQKGLLNIESFTNDDYVKKLISQLQTSQTGNMVDLMAMSPVNISAVAVYGCVFVAIAAVAAEAFVVLGTTTWVTHGQSLVDPSNSTAVQQMWNLKSDTRTSLPSDLTNEIVDEGIDMMQEQFPKEFAHVDKKALKAILLLKLQKLQKNED